nr:lasso peptide biosynthesis B2 protein [uncultured Draconibacterium sp.]
MKLSEIPKYSISEYSLFAEAWLLLAASRSLIFFRPFRKLLPLLGVSVNQQFAEKAATEHVAVHVFLKQIQYSILRASRRSPWRTMCFEQALTARIMLSRRKIKSVIFFGVNIDNENSNKKMTAHAWLICSGFTVTGGKNNEIYTVVGRFLV